jgi:hypothetical protein
VSQPPAAIVAIRKITTSTLAADGDTGSSSAARIIGVITIRDGNGDSTGSRRSARIRVRPWAR